MCILFMYVADRTNSDTTVAAKEPVSRSPYKLILASNRDEKLSRPTRSAYFWDNAEGDPHILAGQDLEEMGTWLGISKRGKLAVLLNIMGADAWTVNKEYTSRGSLVTGFLRSPPGLPGDTYLKNLCHLDISSKYRPFQLVTVDIFGRSGDNNGAFETTTSENKHSVNDNSSQQATAAKPASSICVNYLAHQHKNCKKDGEDSNGDAFKGASSASQPKHMGPPANTCKFYAFGNSVCDRPFKKVACGKKEFEDIVLRHCENRAEEESMVEELVLFLKSKQQYYPDEVIDDHARGSVIPKKCLPYFGARFVNLPDSDYGTRTHTIILVDRDNNATFHEFTMKGPVNTACPEWSHEKYMFPLACESL